MMNSIDNPDNGDIGPIDKLGRPARPRLEVVQDAYHPAIDVESETGKGVDRSIYRRSLKRHKWGIAGVTLAGLLVGVLIASAATPLYRAETGLVATPFQHKTTVEDEYANSSLFYDTQFGIIRSRWVAGHVVDRLGLVAEARRKMEAMRKSGNSADDPGMTRRLGLALADLLGWRRWSDIDMGMARTPLDDKSLHGVLATHLRNNITVDRDENSQIIRIAYTDPDPVAAARIANAVADAYMTYDKAMRKDTSSNTETEPAAQLAAAKRGLNDAERRLRRFQQRTGLVTTAPQTLANKRLEELEKALLLAKTRLSEARIRYRQARLSIRSDTGALGTLPDVLANPTVLKLAEEERRLSRKARLQSERLSDSHPDLINTRTELVVVQVNLRNETQRIVENLKNARNSAAARVADLERLLEEEKVKSREISGNSLELARLEREVESSQKLYDTLLNHVREAGVTEKYSASNIHILDRAEAPANPSKPNKTRIVLSTTILGLFAGVLLAILRERLDRTFKTADDMEDKLKQPILGLVPLLSNRESELPEIEYLSNPRSPFAEKINHIRTGLLFSNREHPPRRIMVTSSSAGEGKSTLASNLAMSFSQLGKTLLIEVNLRNPSLAKRLNLNARSGLAELMANPRVADDAIQAFGNTGQLFILPCGAKPHDPLELISSVPFHKLLDRFSEHFEYIIFDTPPLLAISDAAVLGHYADARLLVVRPEHTQAKMATYAIELLRKSNIPPTGIVLGMADAKRMARFGGNYYRYDTGQSDSDGGKGRELIKPSA